jgi:hypothetical protein
MWPLAGTLGQVHRRGFTVGPFFVDMYVPTHEELLKEAKLLSKGSTKKGAVKKALVDFMRRRKAKKLLQLEGKIGLSFTPKELLERRRKHTVVI